MVPVDDVSGAAIERAGQERFTDRYRKSWSAWSSNTES